MKTWNNRAAVSAMAAVVALGGTWHASLLADDTAPAIEEIRAEVIANDGLVQADVVARNASKAADNANASLLADVLLELEIKLGSPSALVIAQND